MNGKRFLLIFLFIWLFKGSFSYDLEGRKEISFNSGWFFIKGDQKNAGDPGNKFSHWQPVQLPHTWNDKDVLADGTRGYYRDTAWYKRNFYLIPQKDKRYFLQFEGVNQVAEVYVNGRLAGTHVGGYTSFNIELTKWLNASSEQNIAIRVNNSHNPDIPPLSADFTFFGGIYRQVNLIETGEQHFSMEDYGGPGVYISTPEVNNDYAAVQFEYHIKNSSNQPAAVLVNTTINKLGSGVLAQNSISVTLAAFKDTILSVRLNEIRDFQLWSPSNPNVYQVVNTLTVDKRVVDKVVEPLGFRWFHFDADQGFFLNGKNLKLMGANRHQDRIPYGNALSDDMHRQDIKLLKEMGGNFLRTAHYPQTREVLKAADAHGLLVWEEIPLVNEITLSAAHNHNARNMLKEMIRQHYNHPSIIIWAYMNEIYWYHRFKPEEEIPARNRETLKLAKELEALTRQLDPNRYTAMAMHHYPAYEETGLGDIPQIAAWNLYHGWYYENYEDFGKFMDEQKARHPKRIHFISEFGAGADTRIYSEKPERFDFSMEEQITFTKSFLKQIQERPYIAGGALWNLVDFSSENRVDATPHINNKGLLTADRKPKDSYFLVQAVLSEKPVLTLGYPFRHKWVYAAKAKGETKIPVAMHAFSNLDSVTLFIDGKDFKTRKVEDGMVSWELQLPEGYHALSVTKDVKIAPKIIETRLLPYTLSSNDLDLAVNAGSNYTFIDTRTDLHWIPEKSYQKGNWGFIGGEQLYIANKVGTKEDILAVNEEDPLYQTMRTGFEGFKADVADGNYEIELLMVDYVKRSRRFVEDSEVTYTPGQRVFSINVNGDEIIKELDMGKRFGLNVPFRLKFKYAAKNGEGLNIQFMEIKGKSVVSAIRIRSLPY